MKVSYKKLWYQLIERKMSRADLRRAVGFSTATSTKLYKGEPISMDTVIKICEVMNCDVGDIMSVYTSGVEKPDVIDDPKEEKVPDPPEEKTVPEGRVYFMQ